MTESLEQFLARTNPAPWARPVWLSGILFVAIFFALQTGYEACRGTWVEHWIIGDLTVGTCAHLIRWITPSIAVQPLGNQLVAAGGGLTVLKGCEGTEVMFMLIAALVVAALPIKRKLGGIGIGVLGVFWLNQLRLIALFYTSRSDPALFDILHQTVAPIAMVVVVVTYVLFWTRNDYETRHAAAAA